MQVVIIVNEHTEGRKRESFKILWADINMLKINHVECILPHCSPTAKNKKCR